MFRNLVLASALASVASAATLPSLLGRQAADDGSCNALYNLCLSEFTHDQTHDFLLSPWGYSPACFLAATCYGDTPDDFLKGVFHAKYPTSKGTPPHSSTRQRLTKSQYQNFVRKGKGGRGKMTQQVYIDLYYSTLDTTPNRRELGARAGPYPDVSYVTALWAKVAGWTGFCGGTRSAPYGNIADWLQYYASSPGNPSACGAAVTPTTLAPTVTVTTVGTSVQTVTYTPVITTVGTSIITVTYTPSSTVAPSSSAASSSATPSSSSVSGSSSGSSSASTAPSSLSSAASSASSSLSSATSSVSSAASSASSPASSASSSASDSPSSAASSALSSTDSSSIVTTTTTDTASTSTAPTV